MRVASWNIMQGGGSRANGIVEQLAAWKPDIVGLSEFRGTAPCTNIARALADMGLVNQVDTVDKSNPGSYRVLLASRLPFQLQPTTGILKETGRWLHLTLESGLNVITMNVPTRKAGNKNQFRDAAVKQMEKLGSTRAIVFGDTNSGEPGIDEQSKYFDDSDALWFQRLRDAGWIDVWRQRNPVRRDYTWYSRTENGFRIDQVFATQSAEPAISKLRYDWGQNDVCSRLSDHAAIAFDID